MAEGSQDCVGVDAEHGSQVSGGGKSLTRTRLSICDGPADFSRHLLVEWGQFVEVDIDILHGDKYASTMHLPVASRTKPSLAPPERFNRGTDTEALIKEARRHRRQRWIGISAGIVGVVGLAMALLLALWPYGPSNLKPLPTSGPAVAETVGKAMRLAGPTSISVISTVSQPDCVDGKSVSKGSIDVARQSIDLKTISVQGPVSCSVGSLGTEARQFGTSLYVRPSCLTGGCPLPTPRKPWQRNVVALMICGTGTGQPGEAVEIVQSPYLLALIHALPSVHADGVTHLRGQRVNKYQGTTTLAQIQTTAQHLGGAARSAVGAMTIALANPVPSASQIAVRVTFLVDSSDRLVRLNASQPYYFVNIAGHSHDRGYQFQPASEVPHPIVGAPYQVGSASITADLSNFGSAPTPVRPPAARVTAATCGG